MPINASVDSHFPMRVLHVISSLDPTTGGPAHAVVGLAAAQKKEGMQVRVLSTYGAAEDPHPVAETLRGQGVGVELVGPAVGALRRHPELVGTVDRLIGDADVVHVHALWEEVQHQAALAARRRSVPCVFRPCGMLDPWSLSQRKWKKKLYMAWQLRRDLNAAAALHFTAEAERDRAKPLGLRPPGIVEPNGLDLTEFDSLPPKGTFRSRYAAQLDGNRIVLFFSRLHPKKGLDLLAPAFAQAKLVNAVLVIAGPDSDGYGATVREMLERHGVADRVLFTGMLRGADRVAALADAELFVLPSYQENFGIAVVESLAAGTPVVISDQVNICGEVIAGGVGGVVPLDVAALAREINRWMSNDVLRGAAAAKARPFVWERYDWRRIARRWGEHYARIVGEARKSA